MVCTLPNEPRVKGRRHWSAVTQSAIEITNANHVGLAAAIVDSLPTSSQGKRKWVSHGRAVSFSVRSFVRSCWLLSLTNNPSISLFPKPNSRPRSPANNAWSAWPELIALALRRGNVRLNKTGRKGREHQNKGNKQLGEGAFFEQQRAAEEEEKKWRPSVQPSGTPAPAELTWEYHRKIKLIFLRRLQRLYVTLTRPGMGRTGHFLVVVWSAPSGVHPVEPASPTTQRCVL